MHSKWAYFSINKPNILYIRSVSGYVWTSSDVTLKLISRSNGHEKSSNDEKNYEFSPTAFILFTMISFFFCSSTNPQTKLWLTKVFSWNWKKNKFSLTDWKKEEKLLIKFFYLFSSFVAAVALAKLALKTSTQNIIHSRKKSQCDVNKKLKSWHCEQL